MTFGKVLNKIVGGWADAYRVVRCYAHGDRSILINAHGQTLDLWEGMSWWWVETHKLSGERNTAKSLEDLFGNSEPSAHVDSDSIKINTGGTQRFSVSSGGGAGLGTTTPSTPLTIDKITGAGYGLDEWVDSLDNSALKITAPRATGRWDYERVTLETTHPPNPIRRALISLLTGAKWTPYSSKHEMKYYGYLRLMPNPAYLTQKTLSIS